MGTVKRNETSRGKKATGVQATTTRDNIIFMPPSNEQIARRAYDPFLARGGEHGHDVTDWLQAETELEIERQRLGASPRTPGRAVAPRRA
jgi:hypothetical protein